MKNKKLLLKYRKKQILINYQDIIYCESRSNYTDIHLVSDNKKISYTKTLKTVENLLSGDNFLRCHKSFIVNVDYIESFNVKKMEIQLTNGDKIKISRNQWKLFAKNLQKKS